MQLSALIMDSPIFARLVRLGLATPAGEINEQEWFVRTRVRDIEPRVATLEEKIQAPSEDETQKNAVEIRELQYLRDGTSSTSTSTSVHSTSTKKKTVDSRSRTQNSTKPNSEPRTRVRPAPSAAFSDPVAGHTAKSFIGWFRARYLEARGVQFFPEYGRDTRIAKTLIERYGYEHLQAMAVAMLDASENFWMMQGNRDLRQLMSKATYIDKWVRDRK